MFVPGLVGVPELECPLEEPKLEDEELEGREGLRRGGVVTGVGLGAAGGGVEGSGDPFVLDGVLDELGKLLLIDTSIGDAPTDFLADLVGGVAGDSGVPGVGLGLDKEDGFNATFAAVNVPIVGVPRPEDPLKAGGGVLGATDVLELNVFELGELLVDTLIGDESIGGAPSIGGASGGGSIDVGNTDVSTDGSKSGSTADIGNLLNT